MTKAQELATLDTAIATLGTDSYLGPWLRQVKAEVERDIRSDIFPSATLAEARQQAEAIVAEAKAEAGRIVENAKANKARTDRACDEQKSAAAREIARTVESLRHLASGLASY